MTIPVQKLVSALAEKLWRMWFACYQLVTDSADNMKIKVIILKEKV